MFRFDKETILWMFGKFGRIGYLILNCVLLYFAMTKSGVEAYILGGIWIIHSSMDVFESEIRMFIEERNKSEFKFDDPFLAEIAEEIKKSDE